MTSLFPPLGLGVVAAPSENHHLLPLTPLSWGSLVAPAVPLSLSVMPSPEAFSFFSFLRHGRSKIDSWGCVEYTYKNKIQLEVNYEDGK